MSEQVIGQVNSELKIEWKIANFFSLPTRYRCYKSNAFYFLDATWCLSFYPRGDTRASEYISLYLEPRGSVPPKAVTFEFSLKRFDGSQEKLCAYEFLFTKSHPGWGCSEALLQSDLIKRKSELVPADVLTIVCILTCDIDVTTEDEVAQKEKASVESCTQTELEICIAKLQEEFKELLHSGKNNDITLNVSGKKFLVHRSILAARSPVFSAMVDNEMKEKTTGIVNIEDSDPDSFLDFLDYLYTGNVDNLTSENAPNLYTTADKYQVAELKSVCLKFMLNNISVENFCEILTLSLRHHERELIDSATGFFVQNSMAILKTVKWQVFLNENTVAGNELLIKLVQEKLQ